MTVKNILVIKHGAFGDIIMATGPMKAIRAQHPKAHITLLTTSLYKPMLEQSPYFDEIWLDDKPKFWQMAGMRRLRRQLNSREFTRVYDLQTSQRSTSYYSLFIQKPQWSGLVKGEFCYDDPSRGALHIFERQKEQMRLAGIENVPDADVSWLKADLSRFQLPDRFALFIPGCSAHRLPKRWPHQHYAALAEKMLEKGITPVLTGTQAESDEINAIASVNPAIRNLCNDTNFAELAELGRKAVVCVGNDTGPTHLVAATGCKIAVLFSALSDPAISAPIGSHVVVLQRPSLDQLEVDEVFSALQPWLHLDSDT